MKKRGKREREDEKAGYEREKRKEQQTEKEEEGKERRKGKIEIRGVRTKTY